MLTTRYTIKREPRDSEYRGLLTLAASACSEALLVIRPGIELSERGEAALQALAPLILDRSEQREWPGTRLLLGLATVVRISYSEECAVLMGQLAEGLFDWEQPALPEDLCLIRPSGAPWLVSIAHERDAYVDLTEIEYAHLRRHLPQIAAGAVRDGE